MKMPKQYFSEIEAASGQSIEQWIADLTPLSGSSQAEQQAYLEARRLTAEQADALVHFFRANHFGALTPAQRRFNVTVSWAAIGLTVLTVVVAGFQLLRSILVAVGSGASEGPQHGGISWLVYVLLALTVAAWAGVGYSMRLQSRALGPLADRGTVPRGHSSHSSGGGEGAVAAGGGGGCGGDGGGGAC